MLGARYINSKIAVIKRHDRSVHETARPPATWYTAGDLMAPMSASWNARGHARPATSAFDQKRRT